ncbi:pectate lyase-like adhesive domain-containing protein [Furfurilactobacillus milii]|uniref:WxL domain-containing protein n=1 Tax=Furfurilactobacillus milii TaxID=2888272 RepID=A0ABT6DB94_9LACO|nr:pectate lyase-like adhesive domain-containing protein [Furfurilactobacillus milii]QLE65384.1 extracellular protein [Furfurilactobacillus rossiae]MCF6160884.1 hypothetical protein [Furfurilactobacillus milii]MCF6163350.1 hypothetical protein [Furfurilactobacillus milii]MDF9914005.1 hypothetical protein [Furfurilactobacillus milii]QLE67813.1 extracellular protein [Furfurilactobacillus rossiae]
MKRLFTLFMIAFWIIGTRQIGQQIVAQANESVESSQQSLREDSQEANSNDASSDSDSVADKIAAITDSSSADQTNAVEVKTTVHTFAEFKAAYENIDVQEITLAEDISGDGRQLAARTTSLVITGKPHQLTLTECALPLGKSGDNTRLTLRNLSINNGRSGSFVTAQDGGLGWLLTFEHVDTKNVLKLSNLPTEQVSLIETTDPAVEESASESESSDSSSVSSMSESSVSSESSRGSNNSGAVSDVSEGSKNSSKHLESDTTVSRETNSINSQSTNQASKTDGDTRSESTQTSQVEKETKLGETEREVSNISELQTAINEQSVTKIFLKNNISATSISANPITRSLEIDGQQHTLNIGSGALRYGVPVSGNPILNVHDIQVANTAAAFVTYSGAARGQWHFEFGNISTATTVNRLAIATYSDITFSGTCNIDTRAENVYTGSVKMADNTVYTGNVNNTNYSMFYYDLRPSEDQTGGTREFTTGQNCTLNLTGTNGTQGYPIVYLYYNNITLGTGTRFNAEWPGNNVYFQTANDDASLTIGKNAQMNLDTDNRSIAAIRSSGGNNNITVASRGSLTARNNSATTATVDLGTGTTTAVIKDPAAFDLQNTGTGTNSRALSTNANSSLTLLESPFAYWDTTVVTGDPTQSFEKIEWGKFTGNTVTSDPEMMATAVEGKTLHRMAAYNPPGTLQLSSVPGNLNFGRDLIVHQENQLFPLVSLDQPLSVTDQRYVTKQWSLTLTQTQALKNGDGDELTDAIKYKKNDELLPVSNAAIEIETRRNSDNDPYVVSNQWNSDQGLMLQVSPSEAKAGAYNGEITWNLSDVPDETEE